MRCQYAVGLRTIQNSDRIGFEFDDKLLDRVLDGLFAIRHFDRAVVLASDEFALHVDEAAFDEAFSGLAKRVSKSICYVESKNLFDNRNTTRMFTFFLKPVCFSGGRLCM